MAQGARNAVFIRKVKRRKDKLKRQWYFSWSFAGRETSRSFQTEGQAEKERARLMMAVDSGERFSHETLLPVSWSFENLTVAKVAKEFVDVMKPKWAPKTRQSNLWPIAEALVILVPKRASSPPDGIYQDILDWLMEDDKECPMWLARNSRDIRECTESVCTPAMDQLSVRRESSTYKSANTVTRYRRAVRQLFEFAAKREYLSTNTWPQAARGKKTRAEMAPNSKSREKLTVDQILDIIAKMKNHQPTSRDYRTLAYIIWYTGMRPSEARALRIEMCILPNKGTGSATVAENVQGGHKRFWMDHDKPIDLPKTGEIRTVPLTEDLVTIIREHIGTRTSGLICQTKDGKTISEANFERAWSRCRNEGSTYRLYDLRHTHASLAIRAGASPDKIAQWLGNSKDVLIQYYLEELADDEARAMAIYEGGLFSRRSEAKTAVSRPKTRKKAKPPVKKAKKR